MRFNPISKLSEPTVEAYRDGDTIHLTVSENKYKIPLPTARILCDLLSITVYDESIIALMAKRRRLTCEKEELAEKIQKIHQYYRRKEGKKRCKNSP